MEVLIFVGTVFVGGLVLLAMGVLWLKAALCMLESVGLGGN